MQAAGLQEWGEESYGLCGWGGLWGGECAGPGRMSECEICSDTGVSRGGGVAPSV